MQEPIVGALQNTGLQEDCPFSSEEGAQHLSPDSAREVPDEQFMEYAGRLNAYLQVRRLTSRVALQCDREVSRTPPHVADASASLLYSD